MFSIDMSPVQSLQDTPVLIAQAKSPVKKYDAVLGACKFVEPNDPFDSAINNIPPLAPVGDYLNLRPSEPFFGEPRITLLQQPLHGEIQYRSGPKGGYHYFPNSDYRGKDQMTFEVDANGKHFKVLYTVIVVDNVDHVSRSMEKLCPRAGIGYRTRLGAGLEIHYKLLPR